MGLGVEEEEEQEMRKHLFFWLTLNNERLVLWLLNLNEYSPLFPARESGHRQLTVIYCFSMSKMN